MAVSENGRSAASLETSLINHHVALDVKSLCFILTTKGAIGRKAIIEYLCCKYLQIDTTNIGQIKLIILYYSVSFLSNALRRPPEMV